MRGRERERGSISTYSLNMTINLLTSFIWQDGDELTGLHCFRHLRDRVASSIDSINRFVYSTEETVFLFFYFIFYQKQTSNILLVNQKFKGRKRFLSFKSKN